MAIAVWHVEECGASHSILAGVVLLQDLHERQLKDKKHAGQGRLVYEQVTDVMTRSSVVWS